MAISIVLALALMLRVVLAHFPSAYWMAAVLVLVPFSCAGAFLAEAFARYAQWSGRLYAWDLAGAALAAFAIVGVLQTLSAIDACLLMGALAAGAGVLAARVKEDSNLDSKENSPATSKPKSGADALLVGVAILVFIGLNVKFRFLDIPAVPPQADAQGMTLSDKGMTQPLFTELGTPGHASKIVDTRWSAFARTDVVQDGSMPGSFYLYSNGNVPTNMMHWDGKRDSIGPIARLFPLSDSGRLPSRRSRAVCRTQAMIILAMPRASGYFPSGRAAVWMRCSLCITVRSSSMARKSIHPSLN